ncbi:hypothetical protein MAP00_005976 [Monascus purpureus]|nr:hypothetical protein MAP00_005976 [Monascus purpureus]
MADNSDRMFCHACGGVWLRNDHGLTCPHCQSDFTEIIEIPPDTTPEPSSHVDRPSRVGINPWEDQNPWAEEGPADTDRFLGGPGFSRHTYRSPDGRFTFSTTTYSGGFPGGFLGQPTSPGGPLPEDPLMPVMRSLDTIFNGLANTYRQQGGGETRAASEGPQNQGDESREGTPAFAATGRLFPRDAEGPQPMNRSVDSLNDILELFRTDFGGPGRPAGGGGVRVMTGPNPLAILSSLLNFDRQGDAVYSQEEFDRIISQLIEQNVNGNAPPPAPENAIRALPKKTVEPEMLGPEGKAECSICMDPVELGSEVTVLPCKHWFHGNCIEMWLSQHNTCPHCRRPINDSSRPDRMRPEGTSENPVVINDSPERTPRRRSSAAMNNFGTVASPSDLRSRASSDSESAGQSSRSSSRNDWGSGITGWFRNHLGGGTS